MKKNTSRRHRSREFTVQALYQTMINGTNALEVSQNIYESKHFEQADKDLFTTLFFNAYNRREEYMHIIRPLLDRDETTLNPIEKSVLLMAVCELKEMPETPYPVIINEAIEVTKTFGGTDGHKFVNGILDKLVVELRPHDRKRV